MPPAQYRWQDRVDKAVLVHRFARMYGWDYHQVEAQPPWLVRLLPEVWDAEVEVRGR